MFSLYGNMQTARLAGLLLGFFMHHPRPVYGLQIYSEQKTVTAEESQDHLEPIMF